MQQRFRLVSVQGFDCAFAAVVQHSIRLPLIQRIPQGHEKANALQRRRKDARENVCGGLGGVQRDTQLRFALELLLGGIPPAIYAVQHHDARKALEIQMHHEQPQAGEPAKSSGDICLYARSVLIRARHV